VSSIGNAKEPARRHADHDAVKRRDGQIYAIGQGSLVVGGAGASEWQQVQINHLSVGLIPAGATVERSVVTALGESGKINLELRQSDFTTASRVVDAVNTRLARTRRAPSTAVDPGEDAGRRK